jgi:hypothetical protein
MKVEFEKCMHISNELLAFCHLQGAEEYHLDVRMVNDVMVMMIKASPTHMSEDEMASLTMKLNAPRQRNVEQEFWDVMGESETACEMTLVGMLCDSAEISHRGNELAIKITRVI